jgi:hypothetical protein
MAKKRAPVIRIINETCYRLIDLRRLILACWKYEMDGSHFRGVQVTVTHTRQGGYCSGHAWLRGGPMVIRIPKPHGQHGDKPYHDLADLACTIIHELAHVRGKDHKDMDRAPRYYSSSFHTWAEKYSLRLIPPKPEPKPLPTADEARPAKLKRIEDLISKWEGKIAYAETRIKTLKRKRRGLYAAASRAAKRPGN